MESAKDLVSITIPIYNAERFLNETIESVFAQSYTHWELLLVDDGSTDRSQEIARSWAVRYPGKVFELEHSGHRNLGASAARNLGARSSRGQFLAFLDADDIWLPHKLEENVHAMDAHPEAGFQFNPTEYWYEWDPEGNCGWKNVTPALAPGGTVYFPPALLAQSYPLGNYGAPCPCSFLVRRWAFEQIGGFEEHFSPNTYQLYDDIAFLAKVYLEIPVYVGASCLERNRCNRFSMSRQASAVRQEEAARRFFFDWLRAYLRSHGVEDRSVWRRIRKETWFYALPLPVAGWVRRTLRKMARVCARAAGKLSLL